MARSNRDSAKQVATVVLKAHAFARKHGQLREFIFHYEVERDGGVFVEGAIAAAFEYMGLRVNHG